MKAWGGRDYYTGRDEPGAPSLRYFNVPGVNEVFELEAKLDVLEKIFGPIEYWRWDADGVFTFVAESEARLFACCRRSTFVFVERIAGRVVCLDCHIEAKAAEATGGGFGVIA